MCGIGGVVVRRGRSLDLEAPMRAMLHIQAHRGPDGEGLWIDPEHRLGLCHNRLAILDLTPAGAQPMFTADGRYAIVYNGEIYNYQELRADLVRQGAKFRSSSDTEVILEAYRIWGEAMLDRLRGMFAFALADLHAGALFCARDRVGKKPFVYAETDDGFVFASEIPAVRAVQSVSSRLDQAALASMLLHNLRHIPDPATAFEQIRRLRPGHALRVREGRVEKVWRYWTPSLNVTPTSPATLREHLRHAVELRLRADVPVGALLSGGLDSSAIVALMSRASRQMVRTYALGFDKDDDDVLRARSVAAALGTEHREFYFDPDEQWYTFDRLLRIYGEPIMLLPLGHTYALCRAIRDDGLKVALCGNGADELFYGYNGHLRTLRISRWLDRMSPLLPAIRPFARGRLAWLAAQNGARKAAYYRHLARREWAECLSDDVLAGMRNCAAEELEYWGAIGPTAHMIDESCFVALMVENAHSVTIAADLPAMAASVELRAPFLDQEVVSFGLSTPFSLKIPDARNMNWQKAIVREAVGDLVPASVLDASKRGFGFGIQEEMVFKGPWRQRAHDVLTDPHCGDGLFDPDKIRAVWARFLDGTCRADKVAKLFAVQVWLHDTATG
jgi:asparagine synthase (glutamine-hydrolysing)